MKDIKYWHIIRKSLFYAGAFIVLFSPFHLLVGYLLYDHIDEPWRLPLLIIICLIVLFISFLYVYDNLLRKIRAESLSRIFELEYRYPDKIYAKEKELAELEKALDKKRNTLYHLEKRLDQREYDLIREKDELRYKESRYKEDLKSEKIKEVGEIKEEYYEKINIFKNACKKRIEAIEKKKEEAEWERDSIEAFVEDREPFVSCAAYICDRKIRFLEEYENFLRKKKIPAVKAAERVTVIKRMIKEELEQAKVIEYRMSYLINKFPELAVLLESDEQLLTLKDRNVGEYKANYDYTRDYLSKEEWDRLSTAERNQLALDRYVYHRKKDILWVGRDYEMACGHMLTKRGYEVEYHGIKKGFADLGRDLIARRKRHLFYDELENGEEILIIQCKYWSSQRTIRENVVMQLFGSYVCFLNENNFSRRVKHVKPVLMIPSMSVLSEEASKFIELLEIQLVRFSDMHFPRIKCNINNGEKIYHLPFDQQYDRAEIKNVGEFYAYTVEEAERAGFRRAKRHVMNA